MPNYRRVIGIFVCTLIVACVSLGPNSPCACVKQYHIAEWLFGITFEDLDSDETLLRKVGLAFPIGMNRNEVETKMSEVQGDSICLHYDKPAMTRCRIIFDEGYFHSDILGIELIYDGEHRISKITAKMT